MPEERVVWAAMVFNQAKRPERAIAVLEAELRAGRPAARSALVVLADAYRAAGRDRDRQRAITSDPTSQTPHTQGH